MRNKNKNKYPEIPEDEIFNELKYFEAEKTPKGISVAKKRKLRAVNRVFSAFSIFIFGGILVFFLVLSIVDKDATVSVKEKRTLASRPPFSFSELFKGKWTTAFEEYYSDTFPFRDEFISFSKKIETFLTRFSGGSDDSVIVKVKKNENDSGGEGLRLGDKGENNSSKNQETTSSQSTTKSMAENNKHVADNKEAYIQSSVLIANKRAMEIFGYYDSMLENYASHINKVAKSVGPYANVYSLVAPTSIEFYGTREYRTGSHSQRDAIGSAYKMMDSSVHTVDAYSSIVSHTDEYLYFRTDHHWTARGAYYAYRAFCESSGNTPVDLKSYSDTGTVEGDFLGTLYNLTDSEVLASNPDHVEYFMPKGVDGRIYQSAYMTDGIDFYIVARAVASSNKYLAFIAGDQPLEKITTSVKNGRKIIVLKESYGNAFVPFLCNNYEEIYVVDPRELTFSLKDFVQEHDIDDVLLINYAFGLANPTYLSALEDMVD